MIQVAKDALIVRPFEDLLSVANFDEEVMAQFANYTQAMKKSDLTDKLIQPLFSARTIQDLQTTSALLDLARKMVKISWKGQGDPLQVPYIDYLSGSGVSEGTSTEGSEEKLSVTMKSVALAEKAHSTAWTRHAGRLARYSVLEASREALKDWAIRKIEADIRYARYRRASRLAKKQLKQAKKYLKANQTEQCCSQIAKALSDFIGDRLNINATGMTTQKLTELLAQRGVNESIIRDFRECLEFCDFGRFASTALKREDLEKTFAQAEKAIVNLAKEKLN